MNLWCHNYLRAPTRKADYMKNILQLHTPTYATATSSHVLHWNASRSHVKGGLLVFYRIILYHYLD